jgi:hypothetical protein
VLSLDHDADAGRCQLFAQRVGSESTSAAARLDYEPGYCCVRLTTETPSA